MIIKQISKSVILPMLMVFTVVGLATFYTNGVASAETKKCANVDTSIISCTGKGDTGKVEDSGLWSLLLIGINVLTAGVGVLALAGIVWGAVLYTTAAGSPDQIKKARTVFTNVAIGVICFAGMYALLNFLIPGGVFA